MNYGIVYEVKQLSRGRIMLVVLNKIMEMTKVSIFDHGGKLSW